MKIYAATIQDNENKSTRDVFLAVLETREERKLYDDENYEDLMAGTGYQDCDIFYYVDAKDIPESNNGEIRQGYIHDFIHVLRAGLVAEN